MRIERSTHTKSKASLGIAQEGTRGMEQVIVEKGIHHGFNESRETTGLLIRRDELIDARGL